MRLSDRILHQYGFSNEKVSTFTHTDLASRGFCVRWHEDTRDFYLEPTRAPTASIFVGDTFLLVTAFRLVTGKELKLF